MVKASGTAEATPSKRRPGRPRLLEPSPEFLARRAEIITAAAEVFRDRGYDAGTLDDVAEALDLRRASLYYYVKSKANLLYMILERAFDMAFSEFQVLRQTEDPTERLELLIRHHVGLVTGEPAVFSVVFDYRQRLEPEYQEAIQAKESEYLKVLRQTVIEASAAGSLEALNPDYAVQAIFGMMTWTYKWFRPERDDPEAVADACVALIVPRHPARRTAPGRSKQRGRSAK